MLEFPILNGIAGNTFCVTATSTASEQVFSMSAHVMNSRRANFKSLSMNNILFFNSAFKAK